MLRSQQNIRPVAYGLALYFLLTPMDCFSLGEIGSVLRIAALIPLGLMLLELRTMSLRINNLFAVHLLFWFLAMVSLFYSIDQNRTLTALSSLSMNYFLILAVGHMQTYHQREIALLKRAMLWSSWLTVALLFVFSGGFSVDERLTLNMGGKAQDGNYINGYFLYAFSYHCNRLFRDMKLRHGFLVVLLLGIVLMTGSRGALAAFLLCLLVHMFLFLKDTRNPVRNFAVLIFVLTALSIAFEMILQRLPENISVRFSWDYLMEKGTIGRSRVWRYLWNHFLNSSLFRMLFGNGYGTSAIVNQLNGLVAHNLYLDNLITVGVIGLCAQVVMQATIAIQMAKKKEWAAFGAYAGMIGMYMSLSMLTYKPLWNLVILTMAVTNQRKD